MSSSSSMYIRNKWKAASMYIASRSDADNYRAISVLSVRQKLIKILFSQLYNYDYLNYLSTTAICQSIYLFQDLPVGWCRIQ